MCLDLAELFDTERVVPVAIFLRGRGKASQRLQLGSEHHTYLEFRYLTCDLAALPYERFRDSDNIVARLNLPNMHHTPIRRVEVYAHAVRGLTTLEFDPEKHLKYLDFIDIYAGLDDNELKSYHRDYPEEADAMNSFAERFTESGVQQGEARMLERLLRLKFGALPAKVRQRVEQTDKHTLLQWSERVLTSSRLDEVLH